MKKSWFLPAVLFLILSVPLFARSRVIDNAGLLSSGEISELEKLAAEIAAAYNFDLVIVTETNIGSASPMDYADDYFDYNGYGLGENRDGCLFLQVTETRDWWFSTSGRGIGILNRAAFNRLESDVVKNLRNDDPAGAYRAFISDWKEFLVLGTEGKNYNLGAESRRYNFFREYGLFLYIGAWIVSLLIALVAVHVMKAKMNTALSRTEADSFIIPGSLVFTQRQDAFLYSTVTKTRKEESSSSSASGSHTSSSGRSHGGGGGKY